MGVVFLLALFAVVHNTNGKFELLNEKFDDKFDHLSEKFDALQKMIVKQHNSGPLAGIRGIFRQRDGKSEEEL